MIQIDREKCISCFACHDVCRGNVFERTSNGENGSIAASFSDQCCQCGYCLAVCPSDAISHPQVSKDAFEKLPPVQVEPEALENLMFSRRSTRCFQDREVPEAVVERLLDVAIHAGSGANLQLEHIIVVSNRSFLYELEEQAIHAFWKGGMRFFKPKGVLVALLKKVFGSELAGSYQIYHQFIRKWAGQGEYKGKAFYHAPLMIVFHGKKMDKINQANCAVAIRNMELLAVSLGLSTCWSGWLTGAAGMSGKINKMLGLDRSRAIGGALMVGYPKYKPAYKLSRDKRDVRWIR